MSRTALLLLVSLLAAALALPLAAADDAPTFSTRALTLTGDIGIAGNAEALFLPRGSEGLSWEAVATSAVLERTYSNATTIGELELVGDNPRETKRTEVVTFGPSRFASIGARADATLLATALGLPFESAGSTRGFLDAVVAQDPEFGSRDGESVAVSPTSSMTYAVEANFSGDFVNLTSGRASYELRGVLTLVLYDVDYVVRTEDGDVQQRTGYYALGALGPAQRHRYEMHRLTLTDAVLHIEAPSGATLLSREPVVSFDGSLRATGSSGTLALSDSAAYADTGDDAGEYRGAGTISLAPAGDVLAVGAASAATRGQSPLASAPTSPWLGVAAGVILVGIVGAVAWAMRRKPREASLEGALLAMEERRWEDAIEHLDAILAQAPDDAILLVDRAICYEETGRLDEARADYERALVEAPGNAEAHYYYARVLARMRMSTACLAHLARALALDRRLGELARKEPAFAAFRDHPQFLGYLGD